MNKLKLRKPQITLDEIKAQVESGDCGSIYYGANTCWWTTDSRHLYKHPMFPHLPCDPRAGVLMECHDPKKFIEQAEQNPEHYGRHGLDAFVAAYHGNVIIADNGWPTCFEGWEKYNALLDEQKAGG